MFVGLTPIQIPEIHHVFHGGSHENLYFRHGKPHASAGEILGLRHGKPRGLGLRILLGRRDLHGAHLKKEGGEQRPSLRSGGFF